MKCTHGFSRWPLGVFFVALCFLVGSKAHAASCQSLFLKSPQSLSFFHPSLRQRVISNPQSLRPRNFIGQRVSLMDILALTARQIPPGSTRNHFIQQAEKSLFSHKIKYVPAKKKLGVFSSRTSPSDQVRLKHKTFWTLRIQAAQKGTILWPRQTIGNEDEVYQLMFKVIDLIAQSQYSFLRALFLPFTKTHHYISDNIEILNLQNFYKIFIAQNFNASGGDITKSPTHLKKGWNSLKRVLGIILPNIFFPSRTIKRNQFTQEHVDVYLNKGPQALRRLFMQQMGWTQAVNYWSLWALNIIPSTLFLSYAAFMGGAAIDSYDSYVNRLAAHVPESISEETVDEAVHFLKLDPEMQIDEMKEQIKNMPPHERRAFQETIKQFQSSLERYKYSSGKIEKDTEVSYD